MLFQITALFLNICVTVIKIAPEANLCDVQKKSKYFKKAHISISTVIDLSELCVLTAAWQHRVETFLRKNVGWKKKSDTFDYAFFSQLLTKL